MAETPANYPQQPQSQLQPEKPTQELLSFLPIQDYIGSSESEDVPYEDIYDPAAQRSLTSQKTINRSEGGYTEATDEGTVVAEEPSIQSVRERT